MRLGWLALALVPAVVGCGQHTPPPKAPATSRPVGAGSATQQTQPPASRPLTCAQLTAQVRRQVDAHAYFAAKLELGNLRARGCEAGGLASMIATRRHAYVTRKPNLSEYSLGYGAVVCSAKKQCAREKTACDRLVREAVLTTVSLAVHRVTWHSVSSLGRKAAEWVAAQRCVAHLFGPARATKLVLDQAEIFADAGKFTEIELCLTHCAVGKNTRFHLRDINQGRRRLRYIIGVNKFLVGKIKAVTHLPEVDAIRDRMSLQRHHINKLSANLIAAGRREVRSLDSMERSIATRVRRVLPPELDEKIKSINAFKNAEAVDKARTLMRRYGHMLSPAVRIRYNKKLGAAVRGWLRHREAKP